MVGAHDRSIELQASKHGVVGGHGEVVARRF
jgi:hypothetical protein